MKNLLTIAVLACFGAYATSFDISTGDLNITSGGDWEVTGTTTANSIIVNTADPVSITFENVSITGVACAFDIQSGDVDLTLHGSSTLISTDGAGLHVAYGASVTIGGEGYLDVTSQGGSGAGIGSNGANSDSERLCSGAVIINDGHITANGASFAAGIGGGGHARADVTINGGSVTANAGWLGAGIGGGTGWAGGAGTITINGGIVKAEGGNGAGIGCSDEGGHLDPGTITITGGTITAHAGSGAGIGAGNAGGESGQFPQIYISGGSIKASSDSGSPIGPGAGQGTGPAPSTGIGGDPVYLATVAAAFSDQDVFTFTTTKDEYAYEYAYTGSGHVSDKNLYFYLPNGAYTVRGTNGRSFSGTISNAPGTLTRYIPGEVELDLANGSITIETDIGATQGGVIVGLYGNYIISGTTTEYSVTVDSSEAPTVTLDGASITGVGCAFDIMSGSVTLNLTGDNVLTSTEAAGLHVANGSSVTINGPGSLVATSQGEEGAGIGGNKSENSGEVIIISGTITANGASFAAGIGGGGHGRANITIEGGYVTANCGWLGAGIGGGTGWEGGAGSVTINGGFVKANGGDGAGIGCGNEGGRLEPGTVVINGGTVEAHADSGAGIGAGNSSGESGRGPNIYISGGSIKASSNSGSPIGQGAGQGECPAPKTEASGEVIYKATLPDAMLPPDAGNFLTFGDSENVSFTTKRNGSAYSYAYSGAGYAGDDSLYFYMPDGSYVIEGSNGKSFGGTINGADATFVVVPEPALFGLLSLVALCFRRK